MAEVKCYNCGSLFEEDASNKDMYPKNCSNCSEEDALKKAQKDSESMGIKFDLKLPKNEQNERKMSNTKYPALQFISGLLKFISILSAILSVLIFVYLVDNAPYRTGEEVF